MSGEGKYRRKLIEVSLPLEAINKESSREKSIRHGHPSTLHLWWSRKPLSTCRAVLFASLVDDPSAWPELFPTEKEQEDERKRLFKIIEELVKWENSNDSRVLLKAQSEIARSLSRSLGEPMPRDEDVLKYIAEKAPPVLDPFCGGGSIPLEAQRLGLKAYASDLNPIAVLITKALIEIPPKFAGKPPVNPESKKNKTLNDSWPGAKGLADDVRYYGEWMRSEAEKRIGHLYPKVKITEEMAKDRPDLKEYVGRELTVIAWLWARTVPSPNPAANGAEVPLASKFWLSTRKGKEAWVEPIIDKTLNSYHFEVRIGKPPANFDPKKGTVARTGATCIISDAPIPFEYIRSEGKAGRLGSQLMAIVAEGDNERVYLPPLISHNEIAKSAQPNGYPETDIPQKALGFRVQLYGMDKHYKLFTPRQLVAITTFSDLVKEAREKVLADAMAAGTLPNDEKAWMKGGGGGREGPVAYADAVATYLAFAVDKATDYWSALCSWHTSREIIRNTFGRQALPMVWDYAEACPFSSSTGNWMACVDWVWKVIDRTPITNYFVGYATQLDSMATTNKLSNPIISTDPPYYDNIGYADLSDYFYVWLRRSLSEIYPSLFSTLLTPKAQELIASPYRHDNDREKARTFFEEGLRKAFSNMRVIQNPNFPITIYYAFKQSEEEEESEQLVMSSTGWETMLSSLIKSGFTINGTLPMRTELSNRPVASGTNALASSIVLVCRPRPPNAPIATRREFISALKNELPEALDKLKQGNIAPVDLAQAAIGPGMAVFTRYSKVMESDGSPMTVRTALSLINQTLDEVLAQQEGEFDPDTRWAVAWFEQHGMEEGEYGEAETLSKAKNIAINALAEAGIVRAKAGKVRLVPREELPDDWEPAENGRLTVWKAAQYLIKALQQNGESGAAELLKKLGGGMGDNAKDLAYRLYNICERKKMSKEALPYNMLITSWPEITRLVQSAISLEKSQRTLIQES